MAVIAILNGNPRWISALTMESFPAPEGPETMIRSVRGPIGPVQNAALPSVGIPVARVDCRRLATVSGLIAASTM